MATTSLKTVLTTPDFYITKATITYGSSETDTTVSAASGGVAGVEPVAFWVAVTAEATDECPFRS